jgi:hypothetical protein
MSLSEVFLGIADLAGSAFQIFEVLGNKFNLFAVLLISFGLLSWLRIQIKLNNQAKSNPSQLK